MPWKLSAHLRMGFFLHQQPDLPRFLSVKSYTALKQCKPFQETAKWQQAHCPMLGRSLTR
ncbi:hypothetical protein C8256_18415 [Kluyvera genomosp. 2]|uniref:Uncharacterized protein n=1 Tax=Kluyvera genomosp. 2 TaxID=2774054 RepID=A0A2T2XY87_9ENTR|nr:hypothetical protein C8256_18415 [Kluyvera genomosp. 2]